MFRKDLILLYKLKKLIIKIHRKILLEDWDLGTGGLVFRVLHHSGGPKICGSHLVLFQGPRMYVECQVVT